MMKKMAFDDRKKAIIQAAIPLFAQFGFSQTTTKDIAREAGVSEALLYKHFKSKSDLYKLVQDKLCEQSQVEAKNLSLETPGAKNVMQALFLMATSMYYGLDGAEELFLIRKILLQSLNEDGKFLDKFTNEHFDPWSEVFELNYKKAIENGDIYPVINKEFKKNIYWIIHNLFAGISFHEANFLGQKYKNKKDYLNNSILFALRGIGFKEDYLREHYHFEKIFNEYKKKYHIKE